MDQLREHQYMMLEMLLEVDRICKKFDIKYSLFAGTMLGAVRHHGFIPWDDDLDIIMLRPEYEKFLRLAEKELQADKYYLQKEFSEHWPMFFSKLRRNRTTCIERYLPKDLKTHLGVYIDIFPCDNLSDYKGIQLLQFVLSKFVIAKSLGKRGYLTNNLLKKSFIGICRFIPSDCFFHIVKSRRKDKSRYVHSFLGGASKYNKNIYRREWLSETILMEFEGYYFPVSAYYDDILTKIYGDYMVPLAPEKRGCKVHGEFIDLSNSYENYKGIQRKMIFNEYTRSIR